MEIFPVMEKLEYQMIQALLYASPTKIHDFGVVSAEFLELAAGKKNTVLKCYSTHFVSRPESMRYEFFIGDTPMCTCGEIHRAGYPCRHYWRNFCSNEKIPFHQRLINTRWKLNINQESECRSKAQIFGGSEFSDAVNVFDFTPQSVEVDGEQEKFELQNLHSELRSELKVALTKGNAEDLKELQELL